MLARATAEMKSMAKARKTMRGPRGAEVFQIFDDPFEAFPAAN